MNPNLRLGTAFHLTIALLSLWLAGCLPAPMPTAPPAQTPFPPTDTATPPPATATISPTPSPAAGQDDVP